MSRSDAGPQRCAPVATTAAAALALAALAAGCDSGVRYIGADCLPSGTDRELQAAVDQRASVLLCPRAVFMLGAPLVLPQGSVLQTIGLPSNPADMATIRLAPGLPTPRGAAVVSSGSDIHLAAVRFDGNRRALGARDPLGLVELGPGKGYRVEGCAFTDAPGWTHLHLLEPCQDATVADNLIESAPRPHFDGAHLTDGMSLSCAHSRFERNHINDVSSTGIVYFGGAGTVIRDNVITETSTSGYSGINLGDATVADHTGVVVEGNRISAAGPRYLHIGIAVGLHAYNKTTTISGVTVRGNRVEGLARYGLAVDGCVGCTVEDNQVDGWHPVPPLDSCPPSAAYAAALTVGHAGGTLQAGFADQKIDGCLGEPDVLGPIFRPYAGDVSFPDYLAFQVPIFSQRFEDHLDAAALLRADWDELWARAKAICPQSEDDLLRAIWQGLAAAQYGDGLNAGEAATRVKEAFQGMPACAPQ